VDRGHKLGETLAGYEPNALKKIDIEKELFDYNVHQKKSLRSRTSTRRRRNKEGAILLRI
jgi:ribosomal 50S subunit-associated protein YjgA (DUF615 family)